MDMRDCLFLGTIFVMFLGGVGLGLVISNLHRCRALIRDIRDSSKGTSNPPLCRHCNYAYPLDDGQNPAHDPALRT